LRCIALPENVMAISSITASSNSPAPNSVQQQFGQLLKSINSGDLAGAQQAYTELSQSPAAANGPLASTLKQIGTALQSGDIGGAKQALTSLQQQVSTHRGHHHGHGGAKPVAPASASTDTSSATPVTASLNDPSVGANVDKTA
jgi:hypothetical protein